MKSPAADLPTRGQILQILRLGTATVESLAAALGLTANAVRAQLALLERDGLVERAGVRRLDLPGKPPLLYAITAAGEGGFSRAYQPAMTALAAVLGARGEPEQLRQIFAAAGERLGDTARAGITPGGEPAPAAAALLEALGAAVTIEESPGADPVVAGVACPLADAVRECPESCEMVRAMLGRATGAAVQTRCEHGAAPRCRFQIGA